MASAKAKLETLPPHPNWFHVQEIDRDKVEALRKHLRAGGKVPPVVLARYGDSLMPIDGHHRMEAHDLEGIGHDAWVVPGHQLERLCRINHRGENYVMCGGVPAFEVATTWTP